MTEIIVTGGTFEKDYDQRTGELYFPNESCIEEILQKARIMGVSVTVAMMMDSLDMTIDDRQRLANVVEGLKHENVVVTHGTDTMAASAELLYHHGVGSDKTVVLTGAMRPYRLGESDAEFNLGFALGQAIALPSGVYVAMNGEVFTADNVGKNKKTLAFKLIACYTRGDEA